MSLIYRVFLHSKNHNCWLQCRQFAKVFTTIYTKTMNLPVTEFPLYVKKAKRPEHDATIREKYFKPLYQWQREHLNGKEFILHDGPPYANGDVHMGHAVNKISKDFIVRMQIMNGNKVHYIPGWDCHGLPIEMKAKTVNDDSNPLEVRANARSFATETIEKQKREFEAWGVTADWNHTGSMYRTYDAAYVKNQLNLFHQLYSKKLIFRDFKPVYWSPSSKTALAEAEIEYNKNHVSPSLYIRFKLSNVSKNLQKYNENGNLYALIWTTTPWTLPGNQAVCFNPNHQYSVIRLNDEPNYYIVGTDLIPKLRESLESCELEEVTSLNSSDLDDCKYLHPIDKSMELPFLKGNHVTTDAGTGLVHTAPSHGFDDYLICLDHKIPIKCIVDNQCKYNDDAPEFLRGKDIVKHGNELCLNHAKDDTIQLGKIIHSCPIDWRTKKPVIINATHQWFIDIQAIRDAALVEMEKVKIYTMASVVEGANSQLSQKLKQRPYWCISRQRVWGTPIPVFYQKNTDQIITSERIISHVNALLEESGTIDFWWNKDVKDLIPQDELDRMNLSVDDIVKGNDILDIWFDSGISWSYALESPKVADLYLEGYDQFTGWFQSSLITSVAARGISPFKSIFVHGFTVDEKGRKMSKSLGNITHPKDIIENHNVDTLRWWVATHLSNQTLTVKPDQLEMSAKEIQMIRTILKYLVAYAEKFASNDGQTKQFDINYANLTPLDTYILNSLAKFDEKAHQFASNYRFSFYIDNIIRYIDDLSAFYIHNIKDRLYFVPAQETIQTQNILFAQFCIINKILWPIIPHLVEEVWSYYSKTESFARQKFTVPSEWHNTEFDCAMQLSKQLMGQCKKEKEKKKTWNFDVQITGSAAQIEELSKLHPNDGQIHNDSHLCEILQVQSVQLIQSSNTELTLEKHDIEKKLCYRCHRYATDQTICHRCESVLQRMNFSIE